MILSKDGWTDLYVCDADGSNLKRLTKSPQDESSPCWSPDGKWICFAAEKSRRTLGSLGGFDDRTVEVEKDRLGLECFRGPGSRTHAGWPRWRHEHPLDCLDRLDRLGHRSHRCPVALVERV